MKKTTIWPKQTFRWKAYLPNIKLVKWNTHILLINVLSPNCHLRPALDLFVFNSFWWSQHRLPILPCNFLITALSCKSCSNDNFIIPQVVLKQLIKTFTKIVISLSVGCFWIIVWNVAPYENLRYAVNNNWIQVTKWEIKQNNDRKIYGKLIY